MNSREAYIALNMIDGVGPIRMRALLDVFKEPQAILQAPVSQLMRAEGVGEGVARNIVDWKTSVDLDAELGRIEKLGVRVVTREDEDYPKNLSQIYDPPLVLYMKGAMSERDALSIAIVGSRRTTLYGQEMARKLAYQLGRLGVTVVSGLARGIDTAAHNGTLQAKGRTVAAIGCGIDVIYPAENKKLYDRNRGEGWGSRDGIPVWRAAGQPEFSDAQPDHQRLVAGGCGGGGGFEKRGVDHGQPGSRTGAAGVRSSGKGGFNFVQGHEQINQGRRKIDRGRGGCI